jgi:hypothetical protein
MGEISYLGIFEELYIVAPIVAAIAMSSLN